MEPLVQPSLGAVSMETVLSVFSLVFTMYFWLVKARRDQPRLEIYQLNGFRATLRRGDPSTAGKRLGLTQIEPCGVLIANNSSRQNSIVRFDCWLDHPNGRIQGRWGYVDDDCPPWNIPPDSTIALRLACFFDTPEDFEVSDDLTFRVEFITVSGRRFAHQFTKLPPSDDSTNSEEMLQQPRRKAA